MTVLLSPVPVNVKTCSLPFRSDADHGGVCSWCSGEAVTNSRTKRNEARQRSERVGSWLHRMGTNVVQSRFWWSAPTRTHTHRQPLDKFCNSTSRSGDQTHPSPTLPVTNQQHIIRDRHEKLSPIKFPVLPHKEMLFQCSTLGDQCVLYLIKYHLTPVNRCCVQNTCGTTVWYTHCTVTVFSISMRLHFSPVSPVPDFRSSANKYPSNMQTLLAT